MLFALWALIRNPSDLSLLIGLGSWFLSPIFGLSLAGDPVSQQSRLRPHQMGRGKFYSFPLGRAGVGSFLRIATKSAATTAKSKSTRGSPTGELGSL